MMAEVHQSRMLVADRVVPVADAGDRRAQVAISLLTLVLDRIAAARQAVGGDLVSGLVLASISNGNLAHLDNDPVLFARWSCDDAAPGEEVRAPVSGYSVALQLGMARETVRRKINALIAEDLVAALPRGYIIRPSLLKLPAYQQLSARGFAAAVDHFRRMKALDEVAPPLIAQARAEPPSPRMVGRALNALVPRVLDAITRLTDGDLKCAILFIAILSQMSGETKGALGKITAIGLSAELGLSRETARRHVRQLAAMGLVVDGVRGLSVPPDIVRSQRVIMALNRACQGHGAFLERLALAGVLSDKRPPKPA
jgi:biotin operon repressor